MNGPGNINDRPELSPRVQSPEAESALVAEPSDTVSSALDYDTRQASREQVLKRQSLQDRAVGGAALLTLSGMSTKVVALLANIILGRVLFKDDWGAIASVLMVQSFFGIIQMFGLRDVLVQQQSRFKANLNAAFWLSIGLGVVTTLAMVLTAGPVSRQLADNNVSADYFKYLIYIFATKCLIESLQNVPQAYLQIKLRFRELALMNAVVSLFQSSVVVVLALSGAGAGSMLVAILASSTLALCISWSLTKEQLGPQLRWSPDFSAWLPLARSGVYLFGTAMVANFVANGDYLSLTQMTTVATVGVYTFAFTQAVQANVFLVGSVTSVLFATLSKLVTQPEEQKRVAVSSLSLLSMVAVPLNFLQASAAVPLFNLIFNKQLDSVVPFAILSIAMAMGMIGAPSAALMRAQGRFAFFFGWNAVHSTLFLGEAFLAAYIGRKYGLAAEAVAGAVLLHYTVFGVLGMRMAVGPLPGFWKTIFRAAGIPMLASFVGAVVAHYSLDFVPARLNGSNLFQLLWIVSINLLVYLIAVRLIMPREWNSICERALAIYRRKRVKPRVTYPAPGAVSR